MININQIRKMIVRESEYLCNSKSFEKISLNDKIKMKNELVYIACNSLINDNFKIIDNYSENLELVKIELEKYVFNFNYKEAEKHCRNFDKLKEYKDDASITLYQYKVFEKFGRLNSKELLKILEYLCYNPYMKMSDICMDNN